jgi:hypothetical protein
MRLPLVRAIACTGLFALIALTGCEYKRGPRATVKGMVTFNDRPVTAGTVSFFGADNRVGSAPLLEDGSYEVLDAPVGEVTVTVTIPELSTGEPAIRPPPSKPVPGLPTATEPEPGKRIGTVVVLIPPQYKKAETSPLKYTVKKGSNDYDIPLTP